MSMAPHMVGHVYAAFRNVDSDPKLKDWGEEDALAVCWIFDAVIGTGSPALGVRVLSTFQ